jgi:hypothetical protein
MHYQVPSAATAERSVYGRAFDYFGKNRRRRVACVGAVSLLIAILLSVLGTLPEPWAQDEFSYLLAADTFAHGRLTNPTHPLWQHFESFHIIHEPTYASKYPVGQGLTMAVGQVLTGYPIVGVWLTVAAACMAITWMLAAFVSGRWALVGGLLAATHPMVMRWEHNYWGGGVAMLGGALLVGAARRLVARPRAFEAAILAAGIVILANSRPFEGLVVTMLVGFSVVPRLLGPRGVGVRALLSAVAIPAALVVVPSFLWLGYYQWRVTGHPLEMPYMRHEATYSTFGVLDGTHRAPPEYRHEVMRRYFVGDERRDEVIASTPRHLVVPFIPPALDSVRRKAQTLMRAYALNPGLVIALLGAPLIILRDRWSRWAVTLLALGVMTISFASYVLPHYGAPLAPLAFLVAVLGLRELAARRWGQTLAVAALVVGVGAFGVELWRSARADAESVTSWHMRRAAMLKSLRDAGDPALVVVRYLPRHEPGYEWVYNDADIDRSPVVWAREMDAAKNQELFDYFADRRIYVVDADAPEPALVPLEQSALRPHARLSPPESD